jgi:plasmid stability protein
MHCACDNADVGRPLQIRNVPEPVLDTLRERADEVHMSLAAYVLEVLTQHVATKSMSQVLAGPRLRHGKPLTDREIHDLISRGRR